MVAWALVAGDGPISGLAAAVDKDQARLLKAAIERLIASNPERLAELRVTADGVRNSITGASLRIISSDAASSYGELVDFILCDVLCHWPRPELWHSLISTAAKRAHCLLMVLTNAGWGTGWQWQARESARTLESWYFSSRSGSQAPWISAAALEEQQRTLPPPVYCRLWLNEWQHSNGEFVTLEEAEACCDEGLTTAETGRDGVSYLAVIDYGEKCDYTAAVIAHRDGDRVVIDRLDVAVPTNARPVPVQWVDDWLVRQTRLFPNLSVCVDPNELKGVAQRWSSRLWVERFSFAGGRGNHEMAIALRQAILNRKVAWPKDCGRITSVDGRRDDLETELAGLIVKETGRGRLRFDHAVGRHDDRAFVVAVACLKLATELESTAMVVEDGVG